MDDDAFARFRSEVPLVGLHGYELASWSEDAAVMTAAVREDFLQVDRIVHGGILATLSDTTAVCLLLPSIDDGARLTSIEFKLNFLRPARAEAGHLVCRAALVKKGRTVALCDVEVSQANQLVSKGLFTYLVSGG